MIHIENHPGAGGATLRVGKALPWRKDSFILRLKPAFQAAIAAKTRNGIRPLYVHKRRWRGV